MSPARFEAITSRYPTLGLAVVGDFCLDRYFDIDPARAETSLETGLPVLNISKVRCQPGAAGTILNNLVALGIGTLLPVGVCGDDGEGWELRRALAALPGVKLDSFVTSDERHTFTYTKPLVQHSDRPPEEMSRLDLKNWTATPAHLRETLALAAFNAAITTNGTIVLDQVDLEGTGVVTSRLLDTFREVATLRPRRLVVADSRRGLKDWPSLVFKMNARELGTLSGRPVESLVEVRAACAAMARMNGQPAFVTLAERGMVGATPGGEMSHVPSLPIRGPLDIVGAGDSVTANLTAALAAGATVTESMELAMAAASWVVHQLGTTGTASVAQIRQLLS